MKLGICGLVATVVVALAGETASAQVIVSYPAYGPTVVVGGGFRGRGVVVGSAYATPVAPAYAPVASGYAPVVPAYGTVVSAPPVVVAPPVIGVGVPVYRPYFYGPRYYRRF